MRTILYLLLFSGSVFGQYRPSETLHFDLLHTELHLQPDWQNETLEGKAILSLKSYFYPQNKLVLDARGMDIFSFSINSSEQNFEYDGEKITVNFDRFYESEDTLKVEINYRANPNRILDANGETDLEKKGLHFVEYETYEGLKNKQLWTQGEPESNHSWFPTIDTPNQNHSQDIFITVDTSLTTLSNGLLESTVIHDNGLKTDHWSQELPHAVYLTMIAAGDFVKVVDESFDRFEVSYYMERGQEENAKAIFGRTPEMIEFFENLLGVPFPWDKYAQIPVRNFISGAMENTGASVFGSFVMKNAHQVVDNDDDNIIAHELFHHWFGNYVTCESWGQLPLNESFANYGEYLWRAHKYGQDNADDFLISEWSAYLNEYEEKAESLIRYEYEDSEDMFDSHSYQKGGRILHLLRQEVGSGAFLKSLNYYLTQNAFQSVEIDNLRLAFEKITGRDLKSFFEQWFLKSGHPELQINYKQEEDALRFEVHQEDVYDVRLRVKIYTKDTVIDTLFNITGDYHSFLIPVSNDIGSVVVDPDGLFPGIILEPEKEYSDWIIQYTESSEIYARFRALNSIRRMEETEEKDDLAWPIYTLALEDEFWKIRQEAVQFFTDYDGEDFLEVEKKLENIILNDSYAPVRADALLAVKNFLNPYHIELARQALRDTSYLVRASALELLLNEDVEETGLLLETFKNIDDSGIFGVVANHYVATAIPGQSEWMLSRMKRMDDMQLYQYLSLLGSYMVVSDLENFDLILPFFRKVAVEGKEWYSRFAAVSSLYVLQEFDEQAEKVLKEAIKLEKNPDLQEYYKRMEDVER